MHDRKSPVPRNLLIDVLVALFGISSWVAINGLWVELPVMVDKLPESWNLASYIVITSQLANLGPVLFAVARRIWSQKVLELPAIHGTFVIGVTSCVLLVFFWNKTTLVGGHQHSTALLALAFCLAFVDCTSSVLYLPFMANFRETYIVSYLIGEGMSGVLPSMVALAQGVGGDLKCRNVSYVNVTDLGNFTEYHLEQYHPNPRFSTNVFFVFLCGTIIVSWMSFFLLNILQQSKNEMVRFVPSKYSSNPAVKENFMASCTTEFSSSSIEVSKSSELLLSRKDTSKLRFYVFLGIQTYVCTLHNGVLLSIQTYSCLPYGSIAYHLSVSLSSIANPIFCFIAMFRTISKMGSTILMTIFGSVWAAYILTTAILSPTPPLASYTSGAVLVVASWVIFVATVSYTKACIATSLRKEGGQEALFWCGVATQVGSAIGATVTFSLVNIMGIFHAYSPCAS